MFNNTLSFISIFLISAPAAECGVFCHWKRPKFKKKEEKKERKETFCVCPPNICRCALQICKFLMFLIQCQLAVHDFLLSLGIFQWIHVQIMEIYYIPTYELWGSFCPSPSFFWLCPLFILYTKRSTICLVYSSFFPLDCEECKEEEGRSKICYTPAVRLSPKHFLWSCFKYKNN